MEEPSSEPKETHPANLVSLRTQASSLRDQILRVEKEEEVKGTLNNRRTSSNPSNSVTSSSSGHSKSTEKLRKKLAEVEAQLVLALPSLVFQVTSFPLLIDLSLYILCNLFSKIDREKTQGSKYDEVYFCIQGVYSVVIISI